MDSILEFLKPLAAFIVAKVPVLGVIAANGVAAMIAVGLFAEIVEVVALLTASKKDDEIAAKIKKVKDKVLVVLEMLPHVNVPVVGFILGASKFLGKALEIIKAIVSAIKGPKA